MPEFSNLTSDWLAAAAQRIRGHVRKYVLTNGFSLKIIDPCKEYNLR